MSPRFNEALRLAQAKESDLAEVVPQAMPPVCLIVNCGKLLYDEANRERAHQPTWGETVQRREGSPVGSTIGETFFASQSGNHAKVALMGW